MNNLNTGPKEGDLMHLAQVQGEPEEEYGLMTFPMPPKAEEEQPLTFNIDEESITPEQTVTIRQFLHSNEDIFSKSDADLGDTNWITHKIEIENARPVKAAPRRMHPQAKVALEENIDWM